MKKERLNKESIALIDFGSPELGHASGFFANVEGHGPVCITNAHVFSSTNDPRKLDRESVFINGYEAKLKHEAWSGSSRDVALVHVPEPLISQVKFHPLGFSDEKYRLFYCIGWSVNDVKGIELKKIWGLRDLTTYAPIGGKSAASFWKLKSALEGSNSPVDRFQRGWSGAPVFNVRPLGVEDYVVGILQTVGQADTYAYAVQSLDFLSPREKQENEGRTVRAIPNWWKRTFSMDPGEPEYVIEFEDRYHDVKHEEIVGRPVERPQARPASPYDHVLT